ncbi:MAG: hypothetical protein PHF97_12410 [Bacteroidales bacterium]|nr:hypothetical protein [Bacteroidales bacterium]MDD4604589.1 hypothetical protein [Bacteroidales bacterium]
MTGLLILAGCTKSPLDYRYKYTGDYSFRIHVNTFITPELSFDNTYFSDGKIEFSGDDQGIGIILSYNRSYYADLFEDRSIIGHQFPGELRGEFESSKKMHFSVFEYSPGCRTTIDVTGEKIK